MEKVGVLIERLSEQYRNNSDIKQLHITTQLLLSELEKQDEIEVQNPFSVVSVFYPSASHFNKHHDEHEAAVLTVTEEKTFAPEPVDVEEPEAVPERHGYSYFDPMVEIPTLALKQQEVNEIIAAQSESLNDKLKSSSSYKQVADNITASPIKDLRKAIGVNDRYLLINELFRGDQTMYDRSIKTINGFNIYAEAEFWIKRELKLKLGWNENSEAVTLFDQLVKRRFS